MAANIRRTEQMQAFVDAYLGPAQCRGADAARAAGYKGTGKVLRNQASLLLRDPWVVAEMARRRSLMNDEAILTSQQLQVWCSGVVWGTVTEKHVTAGRPPMKGRSPAEMDDFVEVEGPARMKDRIAAAALLSKLAGYDQPKPLEVATVPVIAPEMERGLVRLAQLTPEQFEAFCKVGG